MVYAHPSGAAPPAGVPALPVAICLIVFTIGLIALVMLARRAGRPALRVCPLCAAVAVRASDAEELDDGELVQLRLQCGQCGTWRRGLASLADIELCERALRRDRRRIGDEAVRLVRRRARRELDAFTRVLWSDVVGADDFLARARRSLSQGQGV